jgi:hypothetical protein
VIAIDPTAIGINVLINQSNNAFYDAVQERNWDVSLWQLEYFTVPAVGFVVLKSDGADRVQYQSTAVRSGPSKGTPAGRGRRFRAGDGAVRRR